MLSRIRLTALMGIGVVFLCPLAAFAADGIPTTVLRRLKKATVFVRAAQPGGTEYTGTGFLVYRRGDTGLIATNAHVLGEHRNREAQITVLFQSGTEDESSHPATIAVVDREKDLALLRVEKDGLPSPVKLTSRAPLRETLPVFILGFPFGKALAADAGSPEITVANGTVSSLRKDHTGKLSYIQLDGDLNPGNSGGPVVDAKGALVGVATATIMGTQVSMAIPPAAVEELMKGRARQTTLTEAVNKKGLIRLEANAQLSDPAKTIRKVSILIGPKDQIPHRPLRHKTERYSALPEAQEYRLTVKGENATGVIPVRGEGRDQEEAVYLVQTVCIRRDKSVIRTQARDLKLAFDGGEKQPARAPRQTSTKTTGETPAPLENEPAPEVQDNVKKTPGLIKGVAVAGAGRHLVLKLKDIPGLAVYDTFAADFDEMIRLPSTDFIFTAGGDTALVYLRENNVFQSWDLATFEKKKAKASPVAGKISGFVMGHARGDQALVHQAEDYRGEAFLLDTATLRPVTVNGEKVVVTGSHGFGGRGMQFRSDAYLNNLTGWALGSSPSGINIITRSGNKFLHKREHDSAGNLSIGDDGRIYSSSGKIFTSDLVETGYLQGQALYPGIGGSLYIGLRLNDGTITVYESGKTTPICKWGRFPGWPKKDRSSSQDWRHQRDGIPFDKRIIFIPHHNRIIFFPPENDRIVLKRFDLEATLQDAGVDYLFVTSVPQRHASARQAWSYQVEAMSGAGEMEYQLDLGPNGMQVSPEGLLTWKVPGKIAQTREKVVLLITDGSGEQTYHSFWIEVQGDVVISDDGEKETASGRVHQFDYETR